MTPTMQEVCKRALNLKYGSSLNSRHLNVAFASSAALVPKSGSSHHSTVVQLREYAYKHLESEAEVQPSVVSGKYLINV